MLNAKNRRKKKYSCCFGGQHGAVVVSTVVSQQECPECDSTGWVLLCGDGMFSPCVQKHAFSGVRLIGDSK